VDDRIVNDEQIHDDEGTTDGMSSPIGTPTEATSDPTGTSRAEPSTDAKPSVPGGGLVAGVSGVLVCVLLIMGVGMIVAQFVSGHNGQPGPGALTVGAHVAGAVVGVFCYRLSRGRGIGRLLGLLAVVLITVALLWFFWWSPT
jgi:hypothetical protein